ncbi:MAG: PTS sugar transporter subunit IIA [Termitinemataceae bacterium]|nr:MAG: PTS sugar transporter subunit IIA [Termitinemataceae bacterium]
MADVLTMENIAINLPAEGREDVIKRAGKMLVDGGYAGERYIEGMLKRDETLSCAIGNLIAIPHGEKEYRSDIIKTGIVVITYKEPVEWRGQQVRFVVGIAAKGEEHMDILSNIVDKLETDEDVVNLVNKADKKAIFDILNGGS